MLREDQIPVLDALEVLIKPVVAALGLALYDVDILTERGRAVLRVTLDRPDGRVQGQGVSIDDIVEASREISAVLDVEDPLTFAYNLEVQSPGVERKLQRPRHFEQSCGEKIHVVCSEPVDERDVIEGVLERVDESSVCVLVDGTEVVVPFDAIKSARTVYDWGMGLSKNKKKKKKRQA